MIQSAVSFITFKALKIRKREREREREREAAAGKDLSCVSNVVSAVKGGSLVLINELCH